MDVSAQVARVPWVSRLESTSPMCVWAQLLMPRVTWWRGRPRSVALAWLLQRSPNILLIPGTSKVAHLRENVAGAGLSLASEDLAELDGISD